MSRDSDIFILTAAELSRALTSQDKEGRILDRERHDSTIKGGMLSAKDCKTSLQEVKY